MPSSPSKLFDMDMERGMQTRPHMDNGTIYSGERCAHEVLGQRIEDQGVHWVMLLSANTALASKVCVLLNGTV